MFERAGEALSLLERLLKAAWSMGRQGDVIEILALQALAFHSTGQTPAALAALGQALALAEPEGYVRVFVDEGKAMAELMAAIGDQQPAARSGYVIKLLAAFEPTGGLVEPLSERELEVLRLMAPGLKYKEMAERLFVSVNTIRYHVKNIYGKLGVQSRTLALTRARELGLF